MKRIKELAFITVLSLLCSVEFADASTTKADPEVVNAILINQAVQNGAELKREGMDRKKTFDEIDELVRTGQMDKIYADLFKAGFDGESK